MPSGKVRFYGANTACFIELRRKGGRVFFDTGKSGSVLLHNLALLSETLADIDSLILSTANLDHTGGLMTVLSRRPGLPVYCSPDIFRPRYSVRDNQINSIGL
jgi:metal-dependent hydrolase (beta-lactamase superfamily II)